MISATKKAHISTVHPFPARMAPSIVWDALSKTSAPLIILDPMAGSGTTLVCARSRGHQAIGCDTDPLALTIARAWCADVTPNSIEYRAAIVLERAKAFSKSLTVEQSYPDKTDDETRHFIDFWFDSENRRQLTALAKCISRVRSQTERTLLWCAFSRMIITKTHGVSLAMDVSHSRPHRVYDFAPTEPFDVFLKTTSRVAYNCPFQGTKNYGPKVDIRNGDARALPIENESIDMIISSPPYLNAIDYLRGHKLSLVWMGHKISEIRALRAQNIGSEISTGFKSTDATHKAIKGILNIELLDNRHMGMVKRYIWDMSKVMRECARVLKRKGRAIFVMGDSAIRGTFVKNSEALIRLAGINGLALCSRSTRPLETKRRYLPPPESFRVKNKMQGRMREEVILEFCSNYH